MAIQGHSRSSIMGSVERRRGTKILYNNLISWRNSEWKYWKLPLSTTPLSFDATSPEKFREYLHKLYSQKLESLGYIFAADSVCLSSFKFSWWAPKTHVFWNRERNARSGHPRSLILAPIESVYATFINSPWSYLAIDAPFVRYCRFSTENSDPSLFHPNFWGVPLGLDCWCWGS